MAVTVHFSEYHDNTISVYTDSKFIAHFLCINKHVCCMPLKPKTKIFHINIFKRYLKYIVFFHTAPSPPEEGKPLPRPELATENTGSYIEGKIHEKFVPSAHLSHLCFCQILWNSAFSWIRSNWICHCLHMSLSITLHHPCASPSHAMCVSIFSQAGSPHSCSLTTKAV